MFCGKHGPLLIAEIGGNHEGDFEYAKKLTKLAIKSNVDYIKFQIYYGDTLVSYYESPERNEHFKRFELPPNQHLFLSSMVQHAGIGYAASVWDIEAIDWIKNDIGFFKIGSGDLTAYPFLKKIAETGKPIILSTGISSEREIVESVHYLRSVNPIYYNPQMLGILQCTSMYPISESDVHLHVMTRLKEVTGATIGYSDHTQGISALKYAYAMGAEILEFHFTDSREDKKFRDHKISLTPEDVAVLIAEINLIQVLQGQYEKKMLPVELENNHHISFRRSVYPSRDIRAGEVLSEENLTVLRPNQGIDARDYYTIIGRKLNTSVKKHHKIEWDMII